MHVRHSNNYLIDSPQLRRCHSFSLRKGQWYGHNTSKSKRSSRSKVRTFSISFSGCLSWIQLIWGLLMICWVHPINVLYSCHKPANSSEKLLFPFREGGAWILLLRFLQGGISMMAVLRRPPTYPRKQISSLQSRDMITLIRKILQLFGASFQSQCSFIVFLFRRRWWS